MLKGRTADPLRRALAAAKWVWRTRLRRLAALLENERMTERSIAHGNFTVTRSYPHPPATVFRAWADPDLKRRWHGGTEQDEAGRVFEFRPGGREVVGGKAPTGERFGFENRYHDIVADTRIVYTYRVWIAGQLISASLATVQLQPESAGTRLTVTEYGAFLDGAEVPADRIAGTEWVLDRLGEVLESGNGESDGGAGRT